MCGRFAITLPTEAMARLFQASPANDLPEGPDYNVCPTMPVAVVTADSGMRHLRPMRWGFLPHWYKSTNDGPLLINARAETIAEKPAFRAACRERRCLVPSDGFYEWRAGPEGKEPFFISRRDRAPLVMAGVWQDWDRDGQRVTACAIVTTEANSDLSAIHHRMPVILDPGEWPLWLGEAGHGAARLMRAGLVGRLQSWRVGTAVNSSRAKGAELLRPLIE